MLTAPGTIASIDTRLLPFIDSSEMSVAVIMLLTSPVSVCRWRAVASTVTV